MEVEKRIYSINLCAFLLITTDLLPQMKKDTETNTVYFIFPECHAVKVGIKQWKNDNPEVRIWDYLKAIKQIRSSIKAME